MKPSPPTPTRRRFLRGAGLAVGFFALPGALPEELMRQTPWATQGPLYGTRCRWIGDNDLIIEFHCPPGQL